MDLSKLTNLSDEKKDCLNNIVKERDALIKKLEKLNSFVYNGGDSSLSDDARCALHEQQIVMDNYIAILNRRIEIFMRDNL